MKLFYQPSNARVGDVIPYFDEDFGRMCLFYLKGWDKDYHGSDIVHGWHVMDTTDYIHFTERPIGIQGGTGSVVKVDGVYHLFYCTFKHNPERQYVQHAVSTDLISWDTIPEDTFTADGEIYKTTDWRDPHVLWNEEEGLWWMLVSARQNSVTERNGCIALCVSSDLKNWAYRKPLYSPGIHLAACECADLFRMGDWYYLLYSNYTDGFRTYYRMAKSMNGPWLRPEVDTFDTRCFYAAKSGYDGKERYIYAWNPTRSQNIWGINPPAEIGMDYDTWDWGGAMEVHKLVQRADGTLGTAPPDTVKNALSVQLPCGLTPLRGEWNVNGNQAEATSPYGFASLLGGALPRQCKITLSMSFSGSPSRFGVALQVDEAFAEGYYLSFHPFHNRVELRSGLRMSEDGGKMFPYDIEAERPRRLLEGKTYKIQIFIEDSILLVYIDDTAFSYRMFNHRERRLGLFVSDGGAMFSDIRILTGGEPSSCN